MRLHKVVRVHAKECDFLFSNVLVINFSAMLSYSRFDSPLRSAFIIDAAAFSTTYGWPTAIWRAASIAELVNSRWTRWTKAIALSFFCGTMGGESGIRTVIVGSTDWCSFKGGDPVPCTVIAVEATSFVCAAWDLCPATDGESSGICIETPGDLRRAGGWASAVFGGGDTALCAIEGTNGEHGIFDWVRSTCGGGDFAACCIFARDELWTPRTLNGAVVFVLLDLFAGHSSFGETTGRENDIIDGQWGLPGLDFTAPLR